ncbi:MAG: hypothetical protein NVS2B1_18030 [Bradyrhizobium sp.]
MKQIAAPIMGASRAGPVLLLLMGGFALAALSAPAAAEQVSREQDIVNLRLGQRILVGDGSCPPGQIKEVSGAKMTAEGILRTQKCIARSGTRK